MSYKDEIDCPYCQKPIELDIEIEGDDGRMNLCPIVIPKPKGKGVIDCPKDSKETHWDRLELERRLGK